MAHHFSTWLEEELHASSAFLGHKCNGRGPDLRLFFASFLTRKYLHGKAVHS